ncbi:glucoside xylosyltransferase 2-like, partial [Nilaparvata lugens]|uniref:glucoside xylosyltransferase 2-like n=1 Tax=Nilaparvata lugens TaxID=108931 RepID=UPI00193EB24F
MKLKFRWLFFVLVILVIVYLIVYRDVSNLADRTEFSSLFKYYQTANQTSKQLLKNGNLSKSDDASSKVASETKDKMEWIPSEIVVAVVVCGDRLTETLVMLKSAILFCFYLRHDLRIVIFTENSLFQSFSEKLGEWQSLTNTSFQFELHGLSFPDKNGNEWRKLFKPCAAQRLFLPTLLSHLDKVLYVDTDVIFLAPLSKVWSHFDKMNSTQMAALSPEHEDPSIGWYNRFARHPYYGKTGVNSGVMLMHLARMRSFGWSSYLQPIYNEFKLKLTWGDQDIINVLFHFHP